MRIWLHLALLTRIYGSLPQANEASSITLVGIGSSSVHKHVELLHITAHIFVQTNNPRDLSAENRIIKGDK